MSKQTFTIVGIKDASNKEFTIVRLNNGKTLNLRNTEVNALKKEFASQLGTTTSDASGILTLALQGCTLTADFVDYKAGQKLTLDANSTLVTDGASRDTELLRDNKPTIIKAGEKAKVGDVFVYKTDSFRKNIDSPEKTYYELGLPNYSLTELAANQSAVAKMVRNTMNQHLVSASMEQELADAIAES